MFNALGSMGVDLSRVLDLYAGSGALGIEALSRGADHCDFVERDRSACALIKENLETTGLEGQAKVVCAPVERALESLSGPYMLVMADPPYADMKAPEVMEALARSALIVPGETIVVLEHGARDEPKAALGTLSLVSSRRHGDSAVSMYR